MSYKYDPKTGEALYDPKTGEAIPSDSASGVSARVERGRKPPMSGRADSTTRAQEGGRSAPNVPSRSGLSWQETISPKTVAAQRAGAGPFGQALAIGQDALTLPLGIVAGVGNAAGEFAGSRDPRAVGEAYLQGVATRGGVAMDNAEQAGIGLGAVRGLIRGGAAPAESPLTIPAMILGGMTPKAGAGLLAALKQAITSPIGSGAAIGATGAALRKGEYLTGIGSDPTTISASDFLPLAMGGGAAAIGKAASSGPQAREFAASLIRRAGKPTTDPEVLEAGRNFLVGQGQLPEVTKGAWLPEGIAMNFRKAERPVLRNVGKQARLADETGAMVNMDKAVSKAERSVQGKRDAMEIILSDPEMAKSVDWMKSRALVPDAAMRAKLAQANVPHEGATIPLRGKEQLWAYLRGEGSPVDETVTMGSRPRTVERLPILDEKGAQVTGKDLSPQFRLQATPADPGKSIPMKGYFAEKIPPISEMSPAEILQNSAQMRQFIKDGKYPAGDKDIVSGFQKLPDYQQPIPDIELPVSKGWNVQRGMQRAAYKNEPSETTPQAGRVAAAKSLDQALRDQFAEVAPDLLVAKDRAAPYLAAEPYFTSLERRANTLHMTPQEVLKMAHIKGAQGIWHGSKLLDAVKKSGKLPSYAPIEAREKKRK
jgi:hypothetical protein